VVVTGVGVVAGTLIGGWETFCAYLDAFPPSTALDTGRAEVSPEALAALLDANEQRRLTRVCQLTVAATRLALADAGITPGGELGLVVGTEFGDLRSTMEFADGYLDRGPTGLSPLLFPSTVMNTMAAASSIAVSARAASLTLNAPAVAGQLAVARAARMVASGRVARVIAGGVDEAERLRSDILAQLGIVEDVTNEGATLLVLESRPTALARGARVLAEIRGAAWGAVPARPHGIGRGAASAVIAAAARSADVPVRDLGWVYTSVSRDAERARWERAVLDRAFEGASPAMCDVDHLAGHGAGAGAMRVAAAAWTARTGRLPRLQGRERERVGASPGLAHGLARGGTHVALVVGPGEPA
jgi:3-oxoacyl-[acyl-carrier-protein] synthase II